MMRMISRPPRGHILDSIVSSNTGWGRALFELIDNSLDAGATEMWADFSSRDEFSFIDNGSGCEDPSAMVQLGSHVHQSTSRLGRFGIGGKEAALWIAGEVDATITIVSVHNHVWRKLVCNWQQFANNNWQLREPIQRPAKGDERGTAITITSAKRRKSPSGKQWADLVDETGYKFSRALKSCSIKLRNSSEWQEVNRWEPPNLDKDTIISQDISVDGKAAHVYAGMVRDGAANPRAGFTYFHGWRVIEAASAKGCGMYSNARICGFVQLGEGWQLTKLKDGISRGGSHLYAEVERVCLDLLKRADQAGLTVEGFALEERLNARLHEHVGSSMAKAKRSQRKPAEGKVPGVPTDSGSGHKQAKMQQPGETFAAKGYALRIVGQSFGGPEPIGQVKLPMVNLNMDNPIIEAAYRGNNDEALFAHVLWLLANEQCLAPNRQLRFPGFNDPGPMDVPNVVGRMASVPGVKLAGKPVLRVVTSC